MIADYILSYNTLQHKTVSPKYKVYTNEEVKGWTNAPDKFLFIDKLKEAFNKKTDRFECLMPLDYIESIEHPELEQDIRKIIITNIEDSFYSDDAVITFRIAKRLPEMKNKYDLYSKFYIKHFKDIELFDIDSLDLRWKLVFSLNPPLFMQYCDNRIIIKPDDLQPEWWQEWKKTGEDYDFSKNTFVGGIE